MLQKWGNGLGIKIPKKLSDKLGFYVGKPVNVSGDSGKIIIEQGRKRALKKIDIKKMLKSYNQKTRPKLIQ